PCVLKPQIFVPFAIVMLLWILRRKAYRILAGFTAAVSVAVALTLFLPTKVWPEYFEMTRRVSVLHQFVPTLSVALRYVIDRNDVWLQFAPQIAALVWAIWYFSLHRSKWNWKEQGQLVLLVSVACAPYSFFFDETILLPAVLFAVYRAMRSQRS